MIHTTISGLIKFGKCIMAFATVAFALNSSFAQQDSILTAVDGLNKVEAVDVLVRFSDSVIIARTAVPTTYVNEALRLAEESGSDKALGRAYFLFGQYHRFFTLDYPKAKEYFNKSVSLLKDENDHLFHGRALLGLGAMEQIVAGGLRSREIFVEATNVFLQGDELCHAIAYETRGGQLYGDGNYDSSRFYDRKALAVYVKKGKVLRTAYQLNQMVAAANTFNDTLSVRRYTQELTKLANQYPLPRIQQFLNGSKGLTAKTTQEALPYFLQAVKNEEALKFDTPGTFNHYLNVGKSYFDLGRFNEARTYYLKSLLFAKKYQDITAEALLCKLLAKNFEKLHQADSALFYLNRLAELDHRLLKEGRAKLTDLEASFRAQQKMIENEELKMAVNFRNVIIASSCICFLLGLWIVVQQQRSKRRLQSLNSLLEDSNTEINAQNEELKAQHEQLQTQSEQIVAQSEYVVSQNKRLETSYADLKKLDDAGKAITSGMSAEYIVDAVYKYVSGLFDVFEFGIATYDEESGNLLFPKIIRSNDVVLPFYKALSDEHSPQVWCFNHQQILFLRKQNNAELDSKVQFFSGDWQSLMCVPLMFKDRAIGVVYMLSHKSDDINDYHVDLIKHIGNYASIALENSRNYKKVLDHQMHLAESGALKNKLISIISHDLKGPLNSLKGFLMLFNSNSLSQEETARLSVALEQHFNHTLQLVDSVLLWTRSQMSGLKMLSRYFDLFESIDNVFSLLREPALAKNIRLIDETTRHKVYSDPVMVELVLRNLVANSIKFTKHDGFVKVSTTASTDYVTVCIEDNGLGIPEGIKGRLFQIEQRFSSPGTANEKGTGLGLYLCKEFVVRQGGDIWVESTVGEGSKFYFTVPIRSPHEERSKSLFHEFGKNAKR